MRSANFASTRAALRKPIGEAQQDLFSMNRNLSEPSSFTKAFGVALLTASILLFFYVALTSYKYSSIPSDLTEVQLVRKDIYVVKVLPDNPGGEKIVNQDKMIYSSLEEKQRRIKPASNEVDKASASKKPVAEKNKESVVAVKKQKDPIKNNVSTNRKIASISKKNNKMDVSKSASKDIFNLVQ
jgi:hypothetical protein